MLLKKFTILLSISLISFYSFGQVTVTFPMEKAVFQRNSNNQANLYIGGNYTSAVSNIEARLLNAFDNNVVVNWTTIQNSPTGGVFYGNLSNVPGGWYRLEVRALLNGNQVGSVSVLNRVGIGEVFIISGQSNAQGIEGNQGEVGANDERVLSHNFDGTLCNNTTPNYPSFTQIFSNGGTRSYLSKTALNPWCYGKLGDNLVSRLGVPVVFFNAASTATSTLNWKESSDGQATINHYSGVQYCNNIGMPYSNVERALNYYVSLFGARAILWHQGESDNYAQFSYNDTYSNLNYLISKTRNEINATIPWVIAKASVTDKNMNMGAGNPYTNTISAQQNIINIGNKIFGGPATDDILGNNRSDEVHFYGAGLIELANRWDASLDNNFFSNATPILANPLPQINVTCSTNNQPNIIAPNGFSSYKWVRVDIGNEDFEDPTESNSQSIYRTTGAYRCYMTDGNGNIRVSQTVSPTGFQCSSVTYLSNMQICSSNNGWGPVEIDKSNGENNLGDGSTITLNGVTYTKGLGVHANSEIIYNLNGNYGRFISDIGLDDEVNGNQCGGTVRFEIYKDGIWSYSSSTMNVNSATIKLNIDVNNVNELKLVVVDAGDGSCADHADWAGARLHCIDNQAPTAPSNLLVSNLGQTCLKLTWLPSTDNMEIEKYLVYRDNILLVELNPDILSYDISGLTPLTNYNFTVKAKDYSNNISNSSNNQNVLTLPNPLVQASLSTINLGQTLTLSATNCAAGIFQWSTGATGNSINVSPSDTTSYFVNCLTNGCTSSISNLLTVNVIPNCKSNFTLVSPTHNFSGSTNNYYFNASNIISATNKITNQANIQYKAAKSIILNPGFEASGTAIFRATIGNCPN